VEKPKEDLEEYDLGLRGKLATEVNKKDGYRQQNVRQR